MLQEYQDIQKLLKTLSAGQVKRWHTFGDELNQNVGNHTFGALTIFQHITADIPLSDKERLELFLAILLHDVAEISTGDIPAPFLEALKCIDGVDGVLADAEKIVLSPPRISDNNKNIVFYADKLDAVLFARRNKRADIEQWNASMIRDMLNKDNLTPEKVKARVKTIIQMTTPN